MIHTDIIIVGAGISGLVAALQSREEDKVVIFSRDKVTESNSYLAQGGIAGWGNPEIHYEDTLRAGCYENDNQVARKIATESKKVIRFLIDNGVEFDTKPSGEYDLTREGGHKQNNILHVADQTGKAIIDALLSKVQSRKNIILKEQFFVSDILVENNRVKGVIGYDEKGHETICCAKYTIMATGGIGKVYETTTNSKIADGDGIAMVYRAGGELSHMEFMQFHPTGFYEDKKGQLLLISESLRGEGAILRNADHEPFMKDYHPMKDLAPRDVVARSIRYEMKKYGTPHVWLDIAHKDTDFIKKRFPMIYDQCLKKGVDITREYIPVTPVAHYLIGGIKTNMQGRTSVDQLYACGECAYTGLHGSNRLASNSLLEAAYAAGRVMKDISECLVSQEKQIHSKSDPFHWVHTDIVLKKNLAPRFQWIENYLSNLMNNNVGLEKSQEGLEYALGRIKKILNLCRIANEQSPRLQIYHLINKATIALLVIEASLAREYNTGVFFRSDHQEKQILVS